MTSDDTHITFPTIIFQHNRFYLQINTGELLFPMIALSFCVAYYVETRGLPTESMLYAEPLLYATAILAVITMFGHAVSIKTEKNATPSQSSTQPVRSVAWGVESAVAEQEHPQDEGSSQIENDTNNLIQSKKSDVDSFFNFYASIGLALLTTGYIFSLYFIQFEFATVPFLTATVFLFGERDLTLIVAYAVGFTALLWFVFINWLQVPLP